MDDQAKRREPYDAPTEQEQPGDASARERSVIPGRRGFPNQNWASTEDQQTQDHTTAPGAAIPNDDVQMADRDPPENAEDVTGR